MLKNKLKTFEILEEEHQPTMMEQFHHYNHLQQLIAVLLSSRTKDKTVIPIANKLFKSSKTFNDFKKINIKELEKKLYGVGFYKVKAKQIKQLVNMVNIIPNNFNDLIKLPGVGRKTANCVLSYTFNQPAICVDVHVHRISNRLGWVKTNKPEETEEELKLLFPKKHWSRINKLLVSHGQTVCLPINPKCEQCKIRKYCNHKK
jgi:endonuclease III